MIDEEVTPTTAHAPPKPSLRTMLVREAISWLWVILAFLFITGTIVQARVIPSGSMENTLLVGDHLLMSRFGYDAEVPLTQLHVRLWREPHRQQIVVFRAPLPGSPDYIKRLIGLPGDHIRIVDQQVYVNGQKLSEPYAMRDGSGFHDAFVDNFPPQNLEFIRGGLEPEWAAQMMNYVHNGELVVPPGEYFMMGDNRDDSYDSRYWGFVPHDNIIGTPILVYMSINAPEDAWDPGHIRDRMEAYADAIVHPSLIRWNRLFKVF